MKPVFIIVLSISSVLASCNCDGVDEIRTLSGISVFSFTDSIKYFTGSPQKAFSLDFWPTPEFIKTKGDRKCRRKDLVIANEDGWVYGQFSFYCNRVFIYNNDTFPAYSNLLNTPFCYSKVTPGPDGRLNTDAQITLTNFVHPALGLDYTFHLEGKTTKKKTFKDSCTIYIQ